MLIKSLHLIPDWRGDETLYSWSARVHRLLGGATKETGHKLFGAPHAYKEWSTNSRLDHLELVTDGLLGDVRSILLKRTVLAAYYPFLRPEQRKDFDERAASAQRTPWLTRFGMRASTLDGSEMRWCQCCVDEDVRNWGAPRWRLPHQLPGAWWCVEHDMPLNRLTPERADWVLPVVTVPTSDVMLTIEGRVTLRTLSALTASLIGQERINLVSIKRALLARLRDMGVVSSMKPVSHNDLQHWFAKTDLVAAVDLVQPSFLSMLERPWIYETLLKRRSNHPLLWMMLWVAAFEGSPHQEGVRGFHEPDTTLIWQEDGQGMLWVEENFQGDDRVQAIARSAETIRDAALQLNVSIATVRRYMREAQCSPRLVRAEDRRHIRKNEALAQIESLIQANPNGSKTEIHRKCKGAVSWLAKWEPGLLASLIAQIPEVRERQFELEMSHYTEPSE
jgi:TniQ